MEITQALSFKLIKRKDEKGEEEGRKKGKKGERTEGGKEADLKCLYDLLIVYLYYVNV